MRLSSNALSKKLPKNTLVTGGGLILRSFIQALVFIIIARVLKPGDYGAFAAVVALATVFGHFAGLGAQTRIVRAAAIQKTELRQSWAEALAILAVSIPVVQVLFCLTAYLIFSQRISFYLIWIIGINEVVLWPLFACTMGVYRGLERLPEAIWLFVLSSLVKLAAAILTLLLTLILTLDTPLLLWSNLYLSAGVCTAILGLRKLKSDFDISLIPRMSGLISNAKEGIFFSISNAALRLYADIDKTMLARMTNFETTGIYTAAYRITDMANMPIHAFFMASQAKFFQHGQQGIRSALQLAIRVFPLPFLYAFTACLGLFFLSDYLPALIGSEYETAALALKYLAWLPLIALIRMFIQTAQLTSGLQQKTGFILIIGALSNVLLNLILIPQSGWKGAVWATYFSELVLIVLLLWSAKVWFPKKRGT